MRRITSSRRRAISVPLSDSGFVVIMEDLRKRYDCVTDQRPFPKIAELIGFYTAAFANAELALWQVYGVVLGVKEMEAMILLGELQSFSTKLKAVERFFIRVRPDIPLNGLIKHIFAQAGEVNAFRNKLAHGQYQTDEHNSKLYIQAFATDPVRSRIEPVIKDETNFF